MIRPILEYGNIIYDGSPENSIKRLENIQRQAALACTGAYKHTNHTVLLKELSWPPLSIRRKNHRLNVMYKLQNHLTPPISREHVPLSQGIAQTTISVVP
jgi:hypothetical protein